MTQETIALPLARLTRVEAQALRVLAQSAQDVALDWGGQTWNLTLRPWPPNAQLAAEAGEWWVSLSWSGHPFDLVVPETAIQAWLRARFGQLDLPAIPHPLFNAVFEAACDSLAALLQAGVHDPVRLERWAPGEAQPCSLPHTFSIELRTGQEVVRAQLSTSVQGLLFLAERAAGRGPARNHLVVDELPMTLVAAIGMTWLGLDDMARLKPRDTILFDVRLLDEDGQLWVTQGNTGFRVRRQGPNLTVTEQFMERGWTVPPEDENSAHRAELSALEHLPIQVVFDVGELSLTLGELQTLQVGQPLTLSRPLSSAVSLRVNGALIGTGELVEIEGELGVTITSLFQRPAAKSARSTRAASRPRTRSAPETSEEITP